jgi:transcription initiation factor TFIID subunit 1
LIHEYIVADYDQKADDAVDYEDEQEQYEGPEVQLAPQDMQFYAEAALAGPTKLVEEDNYDEDDDFDSEQRTEAKVEDEDFDSEQPAEARNEYEDFDSEQPADIKMESPVKNDSGIILHSVLQIFCFELTDQYFLNVGLKCFFR